MTPLRILGIPGSIRKESHNKSLLRAAARSLPPGVELELYEGIADLPHYNEDIDVDPAPNAVARLRGAIADADGLLIATPEYNGTIPGVLKNAIDWASRPRVDSPLKGKPTAVVGASTGLFGAVWAQADTRKALQIAGADVLEGELPVGQAHMAFNPQGGLTDPDIQAALEELVAVLAAESGEGVREVAELRTAVREAA
jgi:chromate reductase